MPTKKEILYPFFLECCEFIEDNFWINVFEELSYGKCPYGTYITKNFLCCNFKGKEFSYKIDENKESKVIYSDIYNLFHNKLGLLSEKEKKQKLKNIEETTRIDNENKDKKWNSIKKKNIKDLIIDNFIIKSKKEFCLSQKQTEYLKSIITTAMLFKSITSKDIVFENFNIIGIKGIEFNEGDIILSDSIKNYEYVKEKQSERVKNKRKLSDLWKYKKIDKGDSEIIDDEDDD